jgi:hypothetical protein
LYLVGYRDVTDRRYYISAYIQSPKLQRPFKINFLIDTGASRTQVSWNDADKYGGIIIRALPPDTSIYTGTTGSVKAYLLKQTTLTFRSNTGRYDIWINDLSISDYETTDGKVCPITSSMLGIDILYKFDILFEDTFAILRI